MLAGVAFPPVITVRYEPKGTNYRALEEQCLATGTLPSLAYGGKSCSLKSKRSPQAWVQANSLSFRSPALPRRAFGIASVSPHVSHSSSVIRHLRPPARPIRRRVQGPAL
jgi:hypothetical protein